MYLVSGLNILAVISMVCEDGSVEKSVVSILLTPSQGLSLKSESVVFHISGQDKQVEEGWVSYNGILVLAILNGAQGRDPVWKSDMKNTEW